MFVDRLEDVLDSWRDIPPTHVLVAGAVGWKREEGGGERSELSEDDVREMARFSNG